MSSSASTVRLDDECLDVQEFHQKLGLWPAQLEPGHLTRRKLGERIRFLQEELDELTDAADEQDLAKIADALVDLVYVAKGTALMLGLPWTEHWLEVQIANLKKERGTGPRGNVIDAMKPEGWRPPNHERVLRIAGYRGRAAWQGQELDDQHVLHKLRGKQ